jgi:hypothetical protein
MWGYTITEWYGSKTERKDIYLSKLDNNGSLLLGAKQLVTFDRWEMALMVVGPGGEWISDYAIVESSLLTVDSKGNLSIFYKGLNINIESQSWERTTYYLRVAPNGTVLLNKKSLEYLLYSSLAVDIDDNIIAVYPKNGSLYYLKLDNNATPITNETQITFSTPNATDPKIKLDKEGNIHLVWKADEGIYYKKLDKNLTVLINDTVLFGTSGKKAELTVDSENRVHVAIVYSNTDQHTYGVAYRFYPSYTYTPADISVVEAAVNDTWYSEEEPYSYPEVKSRLITAKLYNPTNVVTNAVVEWYLDNISVGVTSNIMPPGYTWIRSSWTKISVGDHSIRVVANVSDDPNISNNKLKKSISVLPISVDVSIDSLNVEISQYFDYKIDMLPVTLSVYTPRPRIIVNCTSTIYLDDKVVIGPFSSAISGYHTYRNSIYITPGAHRLKAVINPTNVYDPNSSNNEKIIEFNISGKPILPTIYTNVTDIYVAGAYIHEDITARINYVQHRVDGNPKNFVVNWTEEWYLDGVLVNTKRLSWSMTPDMKRGWDASVNLGKLPAGTHTLKVVINVIDAYLSSDSHNMANKTFTIISTTFPMPVDISIDDIVFRKIGSPAPYPIETCIVLSKYPVGVNIEDKLLVKLYLDNVLTISNESVRLMTVSELLKLSPGNYTIKATVEINSMDFYDTNPSNNRLTKTIVINRDGVIIMADDRKEINLTYSPSTPINIKVTNVENVTKTIEFNINTPNYWNWSPTVNRFEIKPNETVNITFTLSVPQNTTNGTYPITISTGQYGDIKATIIVDRSNDIQESIPVLPAAGDGKSFSIYYLMFFGLFAIGVISSSLFVIFTEVGLYAFLLPFVALFTRIKSEKVLDHFRRGQIYGFIIATPGAHYRQIKEKLEIGNGTLAYHLHVLEREGLIKSQNDGLKKLFYPTKGTIGFLKNTVQ